MVQRISKQQEEQQQQVSAAAAMKQQAATVVAAADKFGREVQMSRQKINDAESSAGGAE